MLNSNYIWIIGMCLITLVIMLVIMPGLIDYLHKIKFGQTEREEGLASHKKKNGTPTMGGLAFIIVPTLVYVIGSFFTPFKLDMNTMIILLAFVGYGVVGFIDDYIIVVQKNNEGLKPAHKFLLQSILAVVFFFLYRTNSTTDIWIPIFDVTINLSWFYFICCAGKSQRHYPGGGIHAKSCRRASRCHPCSGQCTHGAADHC